MFFIDADKENNVFVDVEWAIKLGRAGLGHRGGQHSSHGPVCRIPPPTITRLEPCATCSR